MWRYLVKLASALSFLAGIVGWISLPDDVALWPERFRPVLQAMSKQDLVAALFGLSAFGFWTTFVAPVARPLLRRVGTLGPKAKAAWRVLSAPASLQREGGELELVYRIGRPFLEEGPLGPAELWKTPPMYVERLIGVRNVSSDDVRNVRVQVASATQATEALPLTLPPRDGSNLPFTLSPGEMRLVRFVRQEAGSGQPLRHGCFGGKDGPICLLPCDVILAAYADGVSTLKRVSLSLGSDKEIRVEPPIFGELPGGAEPSLYIRAKVGVIRPRQR